MRYKKALSLLALASAAGLLLAQNPVQDWTHFVRIGAYGLNKNEASGIISDAQKGHVFGIEVDNDIPGRYESFLNPAEKLQAIRAVAAAAHKTNNRAFVYIAGTECITANAEKSAHSLAKDHPEWLQRKITGEPAIFTSGAAFWISPGDEDVWVSPYAKEWRKVYMERVRQIAATGIDGIYVDIPYWMTHFEGWETTWASFDDATVAAFLEKTGLDAKHDLKLGDFLDPNFRKWIDFRIDTMTDFVKEIREQARRVNPEIVVIPEIYPGIEEEATRVGADVYEMYNVVDVIAHEYEFGEGEHLAASRTSLDWFLYQAGMLSFRAFAQGKATWILNYSWDGNKTVDKREAMKNLANSIVMAGANFWDAPGHSMAGSNDPATRAEIFQWIERNQDVLYHPRLPIEPVGVYFSPKSRDYHASAFLPSYRGLLMALLQTHREFQVVTPRTLTGFRGKVLVLPEVTQMDVAEKAAVQDLAAHGTRLIALGQSEALSGIAGIQSVEDTFARYLADLQKDFAVASRAIPDVTQIATFQSKLQVEAPATVATNIGMVDGHPHVFIANFTKLQPNANAVPEPVTGITVRASGSYGTRLRFLPFLGAPRDVTGVSDGGMVVFKLPAVERGAVAWILSDNQ